MLERLGTSRLSQPVKAHTVLMRPEVHLSDIIEADEKLKSLKCRNYHEYLCAGANRNSNQVFRIYSKGI